MSDLVLLYDAREQRPLVFPEGVAVEKVTLDAGDYSAKGLEKYALIERKSSSDLWGTVHGDHERFNRELSRLGDVPRAAIVVDDAWGPNDVVDRIQAPPAERGRFFGIIRALQWTGRVPIIWAGTRDRAAEYVLWAMQKAAEDFSPERLARCDEIARLAGPYSTPAELRKAALASLFGICVVCARRPGSRPKPPGPGICVCGRVERGRREAA